jgi:hypothetical protein
MDFITKGDNAYERLAYMFCDLNNYTEGIKYFQKLISEPSTSKYVKYLNYQGGMAWIYKDKLVVMR